MEKFEFHRIKAVSALPDLQLIAQFEEGICKIYDVKQLFNKWPVFKQLSDKTLFSSIHVEGSGFGVVWNDDLDLSCNEIWKNGEIVETKFSGLIGLSDATALWGLNESTLRKAISYGKLKVGYDVCNYGKQWVVTIDAMIREYGHLNSFKYKIEEKELNVAEKPLNSVN